MTRDGALAEEQCGRDLLVRPTLGNERGDALLRRRQAFFAPTTADAAELCARVFDPRSSTQPLEVVERGLDRVACRALLSCAPADDPKREQSTCAPEGIADVLVLRDCLLQQGDRPLDIA